MGEGRTDAMSQVPGGLLTDAEITRQLGAGHAFQAREHEVHGRDPDPTTQRRGMHDGVRFYREVTSAVVAPIWLGTSILTFSNPGGIAMRAPDTVRPATCDEPRATLLPPFHRARIRQETP
ncbi:MAG: hypothetical protein OXG15_03375 [Gammaproteobacteria bacterium]|nr:hypothetical protein [Gammaproteobacteria bacterium]